MELHTLAPNGDVLLILFEKIENEKNAGRETSTTSNGDEDAEMEEYDPNDEDSDADEEDSNDEISSKEDSNDGTLKEPRKLNMLVSSQHMRLASTVFDKMLQPDRFLEGSTLHSEGKVEICLPDDDSSALLILLNIIHGNTRQVPRFVDLGLLTRLAVLVDKYELHEAVEVHTDLWFHKLRNDDFDRQLDGEMIPWLFISWAFERQEEFTILTREASRCCDEKLMEVIEAKYPELPIPGRIIEAILNSREKAITKVFTKLESRIQLYLAADKSICNRVENAELRRACDNMVLGCLLRNSVERGIWPIPQSPFCGHTFDGASRKILDLGVVALCDEIRKPQRYTTFHSQTHGVRQGFEESMRLISSELAGLKISDLKICEVEPKKRQRWR